MASPSAPASAGLTSGCGSPSPATAPSAASRSKHSRKTFSSPGWRTESLTPRLCGETSSSSTAPNGEGWLTLFMAGIRASRSASLARGSVKKTPATSGPISPESSESASPSGASSKTSPGICGLGSTWSPVTWSKWVTGLRQDSLRRRKSEPHIADNVSSFWPTAVAQDDQKSPEAHLAMKKRMGERDGTHANRTAITSLTVFTKQWATPSASDGMSGQSKSYPSETGGGARRLRVDAAEFGRQAPRSGIGGTPSSPSGPTSPLQWPTPDTFNRKSRRAVTASIRNGRRSGGGNSSTPGLEQVAELQAGTYPPDLPTPELMAPMARALVAALPAVPGPRFRLNPSFVEWLMGLPVGWTDLKPLATESYQAWLRSHGARCTRSSAHDAS
jgi:hypothetical protein